MTATILPHQLPHALDAFPGVRVLSLDCFDTLIWRDCHAPRDIFAALPGTSVLQRIWAEGQARKLARVSRGREEVSIGEIYAQLLPNASDRERAAAVQAELDAEARHCYGFAPTADLIRAAHARGVRVVIVSDTYLDARQLRALIAAAAGAEVAEMIAEIHCSSAHGRPKASGLFADVLPRLKVKPEEILHIGDNFHADAEGAARFGVNVLHLVQFTEAAKQRLRLEATLDALLHTDDGERVGALQPHRPALAALEPQLGSSAEGLGLGVLGPVLTGFELWLRAEAEALAAQHDGKVHWLFLMRDGFLPMQVHGALPGSEEAAQAPAHAVEISRFAATAASFANAGEVSRYAELELGLNPATLARQMLIDEDEAERLIAGRSPQDACLALLKELRAVPRQRAIVRASRERAERLIAHVRALVNPAPGDVLMLIDLGYNGTVQNRIDALLRDAFKVHVAGRYLLLRETDRPGFDKRGLISGDHYDANTLEALCANVSVIEQLCSAATGSVADYQPDGTPVRLGNDIKSAQCAIRDAVQAGCLRFAAAAGALTERPATPDPVAMWRQTAAAVLARFLYFPLPQELAVVSGFEHDVNRGSSRTVALFDPAVAKAGLKRRGLFYTRGADRMFLPAELSGQGLAPKLTLLASKRFGLPLAFPDFADGGITLPVIFATRDSVSSGEVTAVPTHDGWYAAMIPIGDCRYSVAVQFGASFSWMQLEGVEVTPVGSFLDEEREDAAVPYPAQPQADGMEQAGPGLYRADEESGFLMFHPPAREDDEPRMLVITFRPLAERAAGEAAVAQPPKMDAKGEVVAGMA